MSNNGDSQCYFVQLQIDGYLDGDLSTEQQGIFMSHVQQCHACSQEFQYAQTVQDAVLDLPLLDCPEFVLEPIHRLSNANADASKHRPSLAAQLLEFINAVPTYARYGFSMALVATLAVFISSSLFQPEQPNLPVVAVQSAPNSLVAETVAFEPEPQYTPQELRQAVEDLNLAIEYLNRMSRRTEAMIGDRFLVTPLQDSLNASFERANLRQNNALQDEPI